MNSEDWSAVDGHGSGSESSDNYNPEHEVRNRPRPMPRPNARVAPVLHKPKDCAPRERAIVLTTHKVSRTKHLESDESNEDDDDDDDYDDDDDDDDDEKARNSVRRAAVTITRYNNHCVAQIVNSLYCSPCVISLFVMSWVVCFVELVCLGDAYGDSHFFSVFCLMMFIMFLLNISLAILAIKRRVTMRLTQMM